MKRILVNVDAGCVLAKLIEDDEIFDSAAVINGYKQNASKRVIVPCTVWQHKK